jgi:hypothetical protein
MAHISSNLYTLKRPPPCAAMAHARAARERRGDAPHRGGGRDRGDAGDQDEEPRGRSHYLEDVRMAASQMRRPAAETSLSWR